MSASTSESLLSKTSKILRGSERPPPKVNLDSIKWVIFPDNRWIKRWDLVVLGCLFLISFILPYQLGVSGGIALLTRVGWLVVNVIINAIFFVDTYLYFFRAYRDEHGLMVFNLKTIRRHYLKTWFIPNFLSVLPFTIVFYVIGNKVIEDTDGDGLNDNSSNNNFFIFLRFAELLKLLRLFRVKNIMANSDAVTSVRQSGNSQIIELWKYMLVLVIMSHWFACIWCFVAFIEVKSFSDQLLNIPNWIGNWYDASYIDGGLNPIGWFQATDRYVLSLFWAIQTITSIGYGNIVPVTTAEWYVGSVLQLCAGMMWAYLIGGLVGVAAGMQVREEAYRTRCDQAAELIRTFSPTAEVQASDKEPGIFSKAVSKELKKYIHNQYKLSESDTFCSSLEDTFPVLGSLSPELKGASALLVVRDYLEEVPYLSSKYLSPFEQAQIALQCVMLEYATGDTVYLQNSVGDLGRGVFVMKAGCAFGWRTQTPKEIKLTASECILLIKGMTFDACKVLLEDDNKAAEGAMKFLTFSKVVFIPRKAIMDILNKKDDAWKNCARWMILRALLLYRAHTKCADNEETSADTGVTVSTVTAGDIDTATDKKDQ